jgi:pimeloyl-ACP methyl ester carboxylesterase
MIVSTTTASAGQPYTARRRRRTLHWLGRGLFGLLVLLVTLAAGATYQAIATARDRANYPPPGQMIDVGGYRLHLNCIGEGSPTVILEHMGDGSSAEWGWVQPELAKTTRVCAYDRAGFGWSDPGPAPRDAQHSAQDLHILLPNAGIAPPYILVGHSYGANVNRLYAAAHPDDVAGVVLVDPGIQFDRPDVPADVNAAWKADGQLIMQAGPWLARIGLTRPMRAAIGAGDLPEGYAAPATRLSGATKFWDTLAAQNDAMAATSAEVLAAPLHLGAKPLYILSAGQPAGHERDAWTRMNASLTTASSNSVHRVVVSATHAGLTMVRAEAQATIDAIGQVLESARSGQPLPSQ